MMKFYCMLSHFLYECYCNCNLKVCRCGLVLLALSTHLHSWSLLFEECFCLGSCGLIWVFGLPLALMPQVAGVREILPVVPETIGTHTQLKYYIHIQTHTIPPHFFPRRHTSITLNEALVFILHQSIVFPPVAKLRQAHYSNMDFQLIPRQKHN